MAAIPLAAGRASAGDVTVVAKAAPEVGRQANARRALSVVIGLEGLALGGCPINALDLGRSLRASGHRVSVFAIDEDVKVSLLPYAASCGFDPRVLPSEGGVVGRARQIRSFAEEVDADVVHVFGPWLGPAASIAAATRTKQVAVVTNWTMENVYFTPRYTPMIVGTNRLAEDLRSRWPGQVWLMEPPVDLVADSSDPQRGFAFRSEYGLTGDVVVAVVVTRVDAHMKAESLTYAIEACARLANPRLRLVIVGDGDAFPAIHRLAMAVNRQLGWTGVVLTGALTDPRGAYDAADICLGMGGSALRALAHGKPLVVLGENGFARPFDPSTTSHFYQVGFFGAETQLDPVGHLAREVDRLVGSRDREALGSFGLNEVRRRFGLEVMTARLERIYHDSLASMPSRTVRLTDAVYVMARTLAHQARQAVDRRVRGVGRTSVSGASPGPHDD